MPIKDTNAIVVGGIKLIIGNSACREVGKEAKGQGIAKMLVVTDQQIASLGLHEEVLQSLQSQGIAYALFDQVPSDPPVSIVEQGAAFCRAEGCNGVVAIGGGSVMDCAKAINMMSTNEGCILEYDNSPSGGRKFASAGYPLFCIPTTSGTGSEVTQYAVITDEKNGRKATIGDPRLVSKAAFLNPCLTLDLPPRITAATAVDALAHAIEAYTSNRVITVLGSSVFSDTYDLQAIRLIACSLRTAYAQGHVLEARKNVMLGATMAGLVSQAGSGAAHGMGTPLGARFHVSHGEAVGVMLPYVMEYNLCACPERFAQIAQALGVSVEGMTAMDAARAGVAELKQLLRDVDFPTLQQLVPEESALNLLAEDAVKDHCCALNARVIRDPKITLMLYQRAWKQL